MLNLEAEGNTQARKFLVLYEVQAKLFFVGSWPQWRRLRNPEGTFTTFDCDNGEHVKTLTYEETHAMCNEFSELSDIWFVGTPHGAQRVASDPPPSLKTARRKEAQQEQKELREELKAQRKQEKIDAAKVDAARVKAAAHGRGRSRGGAGAADLPPRDPPPRDPPPRRDPPPSSPPPRGPPEQPDTPPSLVQMKRALCGLKQAQSVEASAERARQIGELQYDLDRREAKRARMAH